MSRTEKTFNSNPFYLRANPEIENLLSRLRVTNYEDLLEISTPSIEIIHSLYKNLTKTKSIDKIWNTRIYRDDKCTEMYIRLTNNLSAHVLTGKAMENVLENTEYTFQTINTDSEETLFAYTPIEEDINYN